MKFSFYNELHEKLKGHRESMIQQRITRMKQELIRYETLADKQAWKVNHDVNYRDEVDLFGNLKRSWGYSMTVPQWIWKCVELTAASQEWRDENKYSQPKYTCFQRKEGKVQVDIITEEAITETDYIIEFYKERVRFKLDEVNAVSKIVKLTLKSFIKGFYPDTLLEVETVNNGYALVSTTVENSSNKGTYYTRFPTRFHNCIGKDGKKVARPSWERFINAVVDDLEKYQEMKKISWENEKVTKAIKREEDKIIGAEKSIEYYNKRADEMENIKEQRYYKRTVKKEYKKIDKYNLKITELKKELK